MDLSLVDTANLTGVWYGKIEKETNELQLATNLTQELVEKIFELPTERTNSGPFAKLPKVGIIPIPREKPLPKPKPPTRWEKFALEKGIKKKKNLTKVFDEPTETWVPRFGKKRAISEAMKNWVIEDKGHELPKDMDPFLALKQNKKELLQKQKSRQQRNQRIALEKTERTLARGSISVIDKKSKTTPKELERAMKAVQVSTRSMGEFDELRSGERPRKKKKNLPAGQNENKRNLKMFDKVMKLSEKEGTLNIDKGVRQIETETFKKSMKRRKTLGEKKADQRAKKFRKK